MPHLVSLNASDIWSLPDDSQLEHSKEFTLPQTYTTAPRVVPGVSLVDMSNKFNQRLQVWHDGVDTMRYTTHVRTWGNTALYDAAINSLVLKPSEVDFQTGSFETTEDHPWDKPQLNTSRRINFSYSYASPPKVVAFLTGFDIGDLGTPTSPATRIRTYVTDIDKSGFTIHIDTSRDTKLYYGGARWVAYPEDKEGIFSGTGNTMEVRGWNPIAENSLAVKFEGVKFSKPPTVFMALNEIDVGSKAYLRLKTFPTKVTAEGFTWNINSWNDTILFAAGCSYIAFE